MFALAIGLAVYLVGLTVVLLAVERKDNDRADDADDIIRRTVERSSRWHG